jgi:hypothetical protein
MTAILTEFQVKTLSEDILTECLLEVKNKLVGTNETIEDLEDFDLVLLTRVQAILCTLTSTAYEDIVKVVRDKLNLNDLFDNRQKYLN